MIKQYSINYRKIPISHDERHTTCCIASRADASFRKLAEKLADKKVFETIRQTVISLGGWERSPYFANRRRI